jgi:uncharacterized cofD-like protein
MLLSGLKEYPIDLAAIVSMADDGGSTGVLRDELGVLPPGDVRQCLVALSEESIKLRELMNYRFNEGSLEGHSFGNLFLSALEKIEGGFLAGVKEASKILRIRGTVIPVTETNTSLRVRLADNTVLGGEHEIDTNERMQKTGITEVYLEPPAIATKEAVQKIREADLIIIGPGDHYTSIVPNLLVQGIPEALQESKAKIVYNVNLVNKKGHTDGFTADKYVEEINRFLGADRINYVVFNTEAPEQSLIELYKEEAEVVLPGDIGTHQQYTVISADVLHQQAAAQQAGDALAAQRGFIRHDTQKLAKVLIDILNN